MAMLLPQVAGLLVLLGCLDETIFKGRGKKMCVSGEGDMGKDKLRHSRKEKRKGTWFISLRTASRMVSSLGEQGSYGKHGRNLLYLRKGESRGKMYAQSSKGLNRV